MQKIIDFLNNKKILILGFGKEGRSSLSFIQKHVRPASITIADKNDVADKLAGIRYITGDNYQSFFADYDVIIKSPGIVLENSEYIDKITSQTELFLSSYRNQTIGITGTKGKSTTSTLLHHILSTKFKSCILLGNVGIPAFDVIESITPDSICVFELSAHQMQYTKISPHISVLINLFPEHLDHYGTYEKYVAAKENIFKYQNKSDLFICSDTCEKQAKTSTAETFTVSMNSATADVCVSKNGFSLSDITITPENTPLLGVHNMFNLAVCAIISKRLGVLADEFLSAAATYKPLPHRLEYIGEVGGVKYYDDSISTIGETAIQAMESVPNVGSIIIGGMDRGIDYTDLSSYLNTHCIGNIILLPDTGTRIAKLLNFPENAICFATDLENAVKIAKEITPAGKSCVLSPAAASYGFFKNFEERGDAFKKYVFSK